jgi:hypothetical protein
MPSIKKTTRGQRNGASTNLRRCCIAASTRSSHFLPDNQIISHRIAMCARTELLGKGPSLLTAVCAQIMRYCAGWAVRVLHDVLAASLVSGLVCHLTLLLRTVTISFRAKATSRSSARNMVLMISMGDTAASGHRVPFARMEAGCQFFDRK